MFSIKICGVTSVKDAQLAALAGVDAIGLNFYESSPRFIGREMAEKVSAVAAGRVQRVGVFVNAPAEQIHELHEALKLDYVQLHGDEPPEFLSDLGDLPVIRALPFGEQGLAPITDYLAACSTKPQAVLIDAQHEELYGGSGETVDWSLLAEVRDQLGDLPLILAGGLTPFNVAEAIAAVRPQAVDCASGVESRPGNKDPMLVRAFANTAKKGLSAGNG